MRNPARINLMLDMVRTAWRRNPDLRLAQLIMNCAEEGEDIYHVEDAELFRRLDKMHRINHLEPSIPIPIVILNDHE